VDATCGHGRDTLLLAECVGEEGRVYALDIEERALAATDALLRSSGKRERVILLRQGHEELSAVVPEPVKAVIFNLGYLPGGGEGTRTDVATTIPALAAGLRLLCPGGLLLVCLYTGHDGGAPEAEAVEAWGESLPPREFNVWRCRQLNRSAAAPYLLLVERNP
jgi:SAM-dependent methyltransferase